MFVDMEELIKRNKLISYFDALDVMSKWKIYCKYLCYYYSSKHLQILFIDKMWNVTKKEYDMVKQEVSSFDEFCSHLNLKHVYIGDDWEKQGFAQKEWIEYLNNSLYYWGIRDDRFNNSLNWI